MAYLTASDLLPAHAENFERFAKRVDGQCWTWSGPMDRYGYGSSRAKAAGIRQGTSAHRVAYLLLRGDIAPGQVIDHLCRNRACVNPDHLEAVTNQENLVRRRWASHCAKGNHLMTEDNIKWVRSSKTKDGWSRVCRTCYRASARAAKARYKARQSGDAA